MASQEAADAAKERHAERLLARHDVSGVGVARPDAGAGGWIVEIHVMPGGGADLPEDLDGIPVHVVEDGPFRAGPAIGGRPG